MLTHDKLVAGTLKRLAIEAVNDLIELVKLSDGCWFLNLTLKPEGDNPVIFDVENSLLILLRKKIQHLR